jgi:hypothetical protein
MTQVHELVFGPFVLDPTHKQLWRGGAGHAPAARRCCDREAGGLLGSAPDRPGGRKPAMRLRMPANEPDRRLTPRAAPLIRSQRRARNPTLALDFSRLVTGWSQEQTLATRC